MKETTVIQGRPIGAAELEQIRHLVAAHPDWSRHRLSRTLATQWAWRNGRGQLKDMAARTLLLKLEQRGWIELPPRRSAPFFNRMQPPARPVSPPPVADPALTAPLSALLPLVVTEVSTTGSADRERWTVLLQGYHYLSHRGTVGENLQYLVTARQGQEVAAVLFGAAAWQCAERDHYIGWTATRRRQHLHLLANNTRLLIAPWVQVPHLASHLLSRLVRQVSADWQAKYGHPVDLLETFVEPDRFAGTCYQAAGWVYVGQTQGRSRQDQADGTRCWVPRKAVYLYPLHPRFRERLQGLTPPSTPTPILR